MNTLVLDLGTTTIKAAVCSCNAEILAMYSQPAPKISVSNGLYRSDAMAYLTTVELLLHQCQQFSPQSTQLGICYQRSSFLLWDKKTGMPATPLISWQDNRGEACCNALQNQQSLIHKITGLPLTAYFFAPKLNVLLQQQAELRAGLLTDKLRVGTLDSFLIWHWSAGKHYLTDASMAARTLLMDIEKGQWSEPLGAVFNIPLTALAKIAPSNELTIELENNTVLMTSVADQSAAFCACIERKEDVLINLGTGGFVIRYKPEQGLNDRHNYLHTLLYQDSNKVNVMALEGTLNSISAALKPYPYRDCKIENLAELESIYCLAEPSGLGAPFFCNELGLVFSKAIDELTEQQIACLLLEAIIFRIALILEDFNQQAKIGKVYVSGGLSALPCLQQGIALCSPAAVFKIEHEQSGLLGVASMVSQVSPTDFRLANAVVVTDSTPALSEKYSCWKGWFFQLIGSGDSAL